MIYLGGLYRKARPSLCKLFTDSKSENEVSCMGSQLTTYVCRTYHERCRGAWKGWYSISITIMNLSPKCSIRSLERLTTPFTNTSVLCNLEPLSPQRKDPLDCTRFWLVVQWNLKNYVMCFQKHGKLTGADQSPEGLFLQETIPRLNAPITFTDSWARQNHPPNPQRSHQLNPVKLQMVSLWRGPEQTLSFMSLIIFQSWRATVDRKSRDLVLSHSSTANSKYMQVRSV